MSRLLSRVSFPKRARPCPTAAFLLALFPPLLTVPAESISAQDPTMDRDSPCLASPVAAPDDPQRYAPLHLTHGPESTESFADWSAEGGIYFQVEQDDEFCVAVRFLGIATVYGRELTQAPGGSFELGLADHRSVTHIRLDGDTEGYGDVHVLSGDGIDASEAGLLLVEAAALIPKIHHIFEIRSGGRVVDHTEGSVSIEARDTYTRFMVAHDEIGWLSDRRSALIAQLRRFAAFERRDTDPRFAVNVDLSDVRGIGGVLPSDGRELAFERMSLRENLREVDRRIEREYASLAASHRQLEALGYTVRDGDLVDFAPEAGVSHDRSAELAALEAEIDRDVLYLRESLAGSRR